MLNEDSEIIESDNDGKTTSSKVQIWDMAVGKKQKDLIWHEGLDKLCFSPDGMKLVCCGPSSIGVWKRPNWQIDCKKTKLPLNLVCPPVFAMSSKEFVTVGGGQVILWNVADLKRIHTIKTTGSIKCMCATKDGNGVYLGDASGNLSLWKFAEDKLRRVSTIDGEIRNLKRLPSGNLLVACETEPMNPFQPTSELLAFDLQKTKFRRLRRFSNGPIEIVEYIGNGGVILTLRDAHKAVWLKKFLSER